MKITQEYILENGYQSEELDGARLERAGELWVEAVSDTEFLVQGGGAPHVVHGAQGHYLCDCPDFTERPKNCKHILAVRLRQNAEDPAAIRLTLPRSAGLAARLEEFVTKARERYEGRELYFPNLLELENPTLNLKNISQWSKKVVGMNIRQYLLSLGILKETVYFEKEKAWPEVAELVGKNCCLLCKKAETEKALWADCGIRIVGPESEEIDYLYLDYGQQVRAIPPDENEVAYRLFRERQEGKRSFVVLHQSYYYAIRDDIENRRRSKLYTPEERTAMGLKVSQEYKPISEHSRSEKVVRIINKITKRSLPVYHKDEVYWTLREHAEWMGVSGGAIRYSQTKVYTTDPRKYAPKALVLYELERFKAICESVCDPAVAQYIKKKVNRSKRDVVIAPFKFIENMHTYHALVARSTEDGAIEVRVTEQNITRHVGDSDFSAAKGLEYFIDPQLLMLVNLDPVEPFPYRGRPGYLFIDSADGIIPELAFANDDTIEYVEFSDRITDIGNFAFAKCPNLKEIRFGRGIRQLQIRAFEYCTALRMVTIPETLREFHFTCFDGCTSLSDVYLCGVEKNFQFSTPESDFTLHVYPGTEIEQYCIENNLNYETFLPKNKRKG